MPELPTQLIVYPLDRRVTGRRSRPLEQHSASVLLVISGREDADMARRGSDIDTKIDALFQRFSASSLVLAMRSRSSCEMKVGRSMRSA